MCHGRANTPLAGVELLLQLGDKPDPSNNAGDTPWHWARNMGHADVMQILEQVSMQPDLQRFVAACIDECVARESLHCVLRFNLLCGTRRAHSMHLLLWVPCWLRGTDCHAPYQHGAAAVRRLAHQVLLHGFVVKAQCQTDHIDGTLTVDITLHCCRAARPSSVALCWSQSMCPRSR